jgi:malonyl-CoA O-methyltransferase
MTSSDNFLQRVKSSPNRALEWCIANTVDSAGILISNTKSAPYPEVSGYFIPTLMDWGKHLLAVQFTNWLISIQNDDGSWSDSLGKSPYTFDTGQILKGLIAILPKIPQAEDAIRRGCDWMITQIRPNGEITTPIKSAWHLPYGNILTDNIHLYAIEPLLKAGQLFGEPQYTESVNRALAHYLSKTDLIEFNTLSHFHAYVLEALIDLGYPDIAAKGMDKMEYLQKKNGSVPAYPDVRWVCSTGLAQYAIIWYKLGRLDPAERAFKYLCRIQNDSGGFFGSYGRDANYFPNEEISWAAKFFLDAWHWRIKTSFGAKIAHFPDSIDEHDGRVQEILSFFGDLNNRKVIDIGCGKGRFLRILQDRFPQAQLHGLDISEEMLHYCPEGILKLCGNILDIRQPDCTFDAVYSVEALEHAVNIDTAVMEMCRILKPGGKILIIDKNVSQMGHLKISPWEKWFNHTEIVKLLHKFHVKAESKLITYDKHDQPDGLFIAWEGVKQPYYVY